MSTRLLSLHRSKPDAASTVLQTQNDWSDAPDPTATAQEATLVRAFPRPESNSFRSRALPAFAPLLHQAGKDFGLAGVGGDVGIFLGVGHGVVEFDGVDDGRIVAMDPDGQAVMVGAHGVAHELKRLPVAIYPARILAEGRPLPGAARLLEHGPEAVAFEVRRQWQAREVTKRRVNVDEFRQRAGVGSG